MSTTSSVESATDVASEPALRRQTRSETTPWHVVPHELGTEDAVRRRAVLRDELEVPLPVDARSRGIRPVFPAPPTRLLVLVDRKEVLLRAAGDTRVRERAAEQRGAAPLVRTDQIGTAGRHVGADAAFFAAFTARFCSRISATRS
jgi:hypothetical protein